MNSQCKNVFHEAVKSALWLLVSIRTDLGQHCNTAHSALLVGEQAKR